MIKTHKNYRLFLFIALLVLGISQSACATDGGTNSKESSLRKHAIELDTLSRNQLGVGINALALLLNAARGNLILLDSLKDSGQYQYLEQLQKIDYVKLRKVETQQGTFIEIVATPKGEIIRAAISGNK